MAWAMQDESVKVQMFRFVDVLPMLDTSESRDPAPARILSTTWRGSLPAAVRLGLAVATPRSLAGRALAIAARSNAQSSCPRFIAGTNASEVLAAAMRERKLRRAFTLDILGEAVTSEVEAERYLQAYLDLIRGIAPTVNAWPEVPQIDRGLFGELPRVNVSVKLSALDSQFDPIDPEGTAERVGAAAAAVALPREASGVRQCRHGVVRGQGPDAGHLPADPGRREFRARPDVGIVIQSYLQDAAADLAALRDWARQRGTPVWVRLVKGAYWDYETVHAQRAWTGRCRCSSRNGKRDANFERLTRFLLRNYAYLRPGSGQPQHPLAGPWHGRGAAHWVCPISGLELQMLYGMADQEKQVLVDMGYRMRIYMPYGELIPGMAYLVRRLLENTSNDSFLRASFSRTYLAGEVADESRPMPAPIATAYPPSPAALASPRHAPSPFTTSRWPISPSTPIAGRCDGARQGARTVGPALSRCGSTASRSRPNDHFVDQSFASQSDRRHRRGRRQAEDAVAPSPRREAALPAWNARPVDARAEFLDRAADR